MKKQAPAFRIAVVLLVAVALLMFRVYGLGQFLTLSYVKASQEQFVHYYAGHEALVVAAYMIVYVSVTALSLPGATVMTLAGGAVFGLWKGILIISFASSIGATLASALTRFVLRDWVEAKFGERLKAMDEGIAREGSFYLFSLRLVPVFPFFLINLGLGLTKMPLRTFYWVSQLGMLPGTIVYVNAGTELARIESLSGILSPRLLISFSLLGLFPLAMKKALELYRSGTKK